MKISVSYPPLESDKGIPLLSQNRQFQWFSNPTYIYPVVPAYAATMLKSNGFNVSWDDGIAEGLGSFITTLIDVFEPILKQILGDVGNDDLFFTKVLLFIIVLSIVWVALEQIDIFESHEFLH